MSAIRKSARGQDCQVRLPGICNFDPETTVLAHLSGGGMGMKNLDIHAAYCCSACHDVVDGRAKHFDANYVRLAFFDGMVRTQKILIEQGLVMVK